MTPYEVPEEILEAAVRAAWENETGCMWNSRSRVNEKGRNDLRVALAAALPLWTNLVDETRRSNDPLDSREIKHPGKLLLPDLLTYGDDTLEEEILASMKLPLDPNAALPVSCCGTARSALARAAKDAQESVEGSE
jgi:hypothetical protein